MKRIAQLTLLSLATILIFTGGTNAQNRTVLAEAERISGDRFTKVTRTPMGATVYALKQPSAKTLTAIDNGLTDLFYLSRKNNYRKRLNYSDYTIYIAKADRTKNIDGNYSPDIAVDAAQYAGSIYDKGGYVYASGMIVALNPCAFLIAEHTKEYERISEVVRYEGEHLVLYHNDRQRYTETADHSKGGGHPILN